MPIQQELDDSSYPDNLQTANIPIIDDEECQMIYGLERVNENMICAGYETGGVDTCSGDSGGPLIFDNFQIGIVSFGRHCGHARNPGVYSKVAHYREWINEIVGI
uniref:Peptidase S1 domain-containing protein n=1 Tax=Timema bartmani TaxID=61472 RepID=A0A7R9I716_9NEOP|nr:unnamed protein product [Timema bartmani]